MSYYLICELKVRAQNRNPLPVLPPYMERIIPEKQANTLLAIGVFLGTYFGLGHIEAESKKTQLLAKNGYLELYGSCTKLDLPNNPDTNYTVVLLAGGDGYSFSTALHWERVTNELKSRGNTPPVWRYRSKSSSIMPGFVYISSGFSVVSSRNLEDVIIPEQTVEGNLFCPALAIQKLRDEFLALFPSIRNSHPNRQDEIFRGVKET